MSQSYYIASAVGDAAAGPLFTGSAEQKNGAIPSDTMNKFNQPRRDLLKEKRTKRASLRRLRSGNPSLKLPVNTPNHSLSGKRQRKLLKKWRRAQKNAFESGLVTMQDIEMMATDDGQEQFDDAEKKSLRVSVKKRAKLMLKKSKKKGVQISANEDVMMH